MQRKKRTGAQTAAIRFDSKKCIACWRCIAVCPENVFRRLNLIVHKHAKIVNAGRCTGCRKCVKVCEVGAIEVIASDAL